jgi:AcrR family transcriptional regulator
MNKAIQEERMRGYFIDAAMELIRAEGITVVTARNVAEKAGYSYATLYNYFEDIRDLIFSCLEVFMKECRVYVESNTVNCQSGKNKLIALTDEYVKFFVQYPGIFDLFYTQKPNDISTKRSDFKALDSFFDSLTEPDWNECKKILRLTESEYIDLKSNHKLAIHGLLSLYLNRRRAVDFKQFTTEISRINSFFIR